MYVFEYCRCVCVVGIAIYLESSVCSEEKTITKRVNIYISGLLHHPILLVWQQGAKRLYRYRSSVALKIAACSRDLDLE